MVTSKGKCSMPRLSYSELTNFLNSNLNLIDCDVQPNYSPTDPIIPQQSLTLLISSRFSIIGVSISPFVNRRRAT